MLLSGNVVSPHHVFVPLDARENFLELDGDIRMDRSGVKSPHLYSRRPQAVALVDARQLDASMEGVSQSWVGTQDGFQLLLCK